MATKMKKARRKKSRKSGRSPGAPRTRVAPDGTGKLLKTAARLQEIGDHDRAEEIYQRVLAKEPDNHFALHFTGAIALHRGDLDRAEELIGKSIELNPGFSSYHHNFGHLRIAQKRLDDAIAEFQKAIELNPGAAGPIVDLGTVFMENGRGEEAYAHLKKALAIEPENALAIINLGSLYLKCGRKKEALEYYETLLRLDPGHKKARHMTEALRGDGGLESGSHEYAADLFNSYADRFEDHLKDGLRYRAPELLREAVGRAVDAEGAAWKILDLGCGTGLCGTAFRDLATHMAGVDLAPNMVEKAREKDVYDALEAGDLTEALGAYSGDLDLAVSADVFIYVGKLDEVFAACGAALREGGLFAFTVESFGGEGVYLRNTGRFAHSPRYIEALAEEHGFSLLLQDNIVVRTESSKPIAGLLYVLSKGEAVPALQAREAAAAPIDIPDAIQTALLQLQAGNLGEAEKIYRRILEIEPDHADALHYLGVIAQRTGHLDDAAELIGRAIEKNPADSSYHTNLGLVFYAQDNLDGAVASLKKSLELNPLGVDAMNNLAMFLKLQGKLDEAEKYVRHALEIRPAFAAAHNNLGVILSDMEKAEEAGACFRKAVDLQPEYIDGIRNLASSLSEQGEFEEAERYCRRLLKLRPGDAGANEMLEACLAERGE